MEQSVDPAQIDESAVVGEVLHHAGEDGAFLEPIERGPLAYVVLFFDGQLARDHHVAAAAVHLHDLHRDVLAVVRIQVVDGAHVHLRAGHERLDAHVHRKPALHASQHAARYHQAFSIGLLQVLPCAQAAGLVVRQEDVAFHLRAVPVDHHIDAVAGLNRNVAVGRGELFDGHQPLGLVTEIDDHFLVRDFEHPAFQHLAFRGRRKMTVVLHEVFVVFLGKGRLRSYLGVILPGGHSQVSGFDLSVESRSGHTAGDRGSCDPRASTAWAHKDGIGLYLYSRDPSATNR